MRVLHVIDQFGAGGPARSLLAFVRHVRALAPEVDHQVVSLGSDGYPPLIFEARALGLRVRRAPSETELAPLIAASDVVLLHFWNTPRFWHFLAAAPPARYLLWSKVMGTTHPQMLSRALVQAVAGIVFTADPGRDARARWHRTDLVIVPGIADFRRVGDVRPAPHAGFNVDYVGTLNSGKLHPDFVAMMSGIDVPDIRVRVCGGRPDPVLAAAVAASTAPDRFLFPGFVEDIASFLAASDVFGYPLSARTYATSDKSLQEAMYAGVPPVVLGSRGPSAFVENGRTGIVAGTTEEFTAAIEFLHHHPDRRRELGRQARQHARQAFSPERQSAALLRVASQVARQPAAVPLRTGATAPDAAALFLVSQGWDVVDACAAIASWRLHGNPTLDRWIADLPAEAYDVEGGIAHWRNFAPDHPVLLWWSALRLHGLGRAADAAQEAAAAVVAGAPAAHAQLPAAVA